MKNSQNIEKVMADLAAMSTEDVKLFYSTHIRYMPASPNGKLASRELARRGV